MPQTTFAMTHSQKAMMKDFETQFFELLEKYWNPDDSDLYWDQLTEEAMTLLEKFQTSNQIVNNMLSNFVAAFLNSREEMI